MIPPPVTRDEILKAFGSAFARPENLRQQHTKPRASALASCARQQAYDMCATVQDEIGVAGSRLSYDADLTSEQGRAFEGLMERTLSSIGIQVVGAQSTLPEDYPVSGHPDGELDLSGKGENNQVLEVQGRTRWGVEFKHLGRYGYEKVIKNGLRVGAPQYILQGGLYGDALGWDAVLYIVSSQDASSIRADAAASLRYKTPSARWAELIDWHPKLHLETLEIKEVQNGLLPVAKARARWLSTWKAESGDPAGVAREYVPENAQFPCTYCPYLKTCLEDGDGGQRAPELPFRMD